MKYIIKTSQEVKRLQALIYVGLVTSENRKDFEPPKIKPEGTSDYFKPIDSEGLIAPVTNQMIAFSNSDFEGAAEAKEIIGDVFYTYEELISLQKIIEEV